ncbi:MAG TPA: type II CAAX endopeptidase family protein [Verrucomicrobiae bacterium]|nr:type II CAAX endopeptidase family protein [Verrucomicrobiae bacterium]
MLKLRIPEAIRPLLAWFNVHDLPLVCAKWKTEAAMRLLAWLLICFCSIVILTSTVQLFTGAAIGRNSILGLVISSMSFHGSVLVLVPIFLRREGISVSEAFGFSTPRIERAIMLGVLAAVFFVPIGFVLQQASSWAITTLLHMTPVREQAVQTITENRTWIRRVCLAVFAILVAPVAEETLFRGILYSTIKQMGHPRLAMWGVAVLFGLIHMNLETFVPLTIFGALLTLLYERTGNLLSPILAHSLFNGLEFVIFLVAEKAGVG